LVLTLLAIFSTQGIVVNTCRAPSCGHPITIAISPMAVGVLFALPCTSPPRQTVLNPSVSTIFPIYLVTMLSAANDALLCLSATVASVQV
jgi:hypothetical protein